MQTAKAFIQLAIQAENFGNFSHFCASMLIAFKL